MKDEITALRNNETKREALASKFLIGFRALYAEALKTGPSDRGAVGSKIDDAFGDIDRLAKESAKLFVAMITPGGAASAPLPAVSPAPVGGHGGAPVGAASTQSLPRGKVGQNRLT